MAATNASPYLFQVLKSLQNRQKSKKLPPKNTGRYQLPPTILDEKRQLTPSRTNLESMAEFLMVQHSHPSFMSADAVAGQTFRFLNDGRFDRSCCSCQSNPTRETASLSR